VRFPVPNALDPRNPIQFAHRQSPQRQNPRPVILPVAAILSDCDGAHITSLEPARSGFNAQRLNAIGSALPSK
jgi:hypothetical protein